MCFTPDGAFTYILGELDNSVTCCRHQDGVLSEFQSLSSLTEGTPHATAGGGAEIICHPSGKWVYATIRGTRAVAEDPYPHNHAFNTIAVFAVQPDGSLSLLENVDSGGNMPWVRATAAFSLRLLLPGACSRAGGA